MKIVVLFALLFAVAIAGKTRWFELNNYSFDRYVKEYGKNYSPEEIEHRRSVFEARLEQIKKHNQDSTKTWKNGINHFSDRTEEELKQLLGYRKELAYLSKSQKEAKRYVSPFPKQLLNAPIPKHVDWREKGVVTAVKDQGQCGSCWTFGTAETVESHFAIHTGDLMDLSEQQILDCTPNPNQCGGTGGCGGGTAELAMARIIQMGGLSSEWTYSYQSYWGKNFQCQFNTSQTAPIAKLSAYVDCPSNEYSPIIAAVAHAGPLVISVDASSWFAYESGVFDGCNQTNPDIDHAVQLVGYGTDAQHGDYYLVRNSWSSQWGDQGYIKLRRTANEQTRCGTDLNPSDGTGCANGPKTVTVCGTCGILYDVSYPIMAK
jgi:cathepsin L